MTNTIEKMQHQTQVRIHSRCLPEIIIAGHRRKQVKSKPKSEESV